MKEGMNMFDILVDHPKKRLYGCLMMIGFVLEVTLLFDLVFGFDVLRAPTFNELLNLQNQNELSFSHISSSLALVQGLLT